MNTSGTSDEKIMAALAHGSVFFAFLGPIVPVIIWATQRKKSRFASFHALQAMGYQTLLFWLWIVGMPLIVMLMMCLAIALSIFIIGDSTNAEVVPFFLQIFIFISIFGMMGLFFLTGIIGAVYCLLGKDFRYPLIGKRLERYLPYNDDPDSQMDETQEDNWVAGICHATAILQLWGVVTPLIVWFTQKERSVRLRFQSMQAFVYQAIASLTYMLGMVVYMLFFFGMFFTAILGGTMGSNNEPQGPAAGLMLIFFGVIMIFWLVIMILMPIYYILAGIASFRVIRGRHFRYPILGKIIEKRMKITQSLEPMP